jgi:hypothetical protein
MLEDLELILMEKMKTKKILTRRNLMGDEVLRGLEDDEENSTK